VKATTDRTNTREGEKRKVGKETKTNQTMWIRETTFRVSRDRSWSTAWRLRCYGIIISPFYQPPPCLDFCFREQNLPHSLSDFLYAIQNNCFVQI